MALRGKDETGEYPPQRFRDLFTRVDELLIVLNETQKKQNIILERLSSSLMPAPAPVGETVKERLIREAPTKARLLSLQERFREIFNNDDTLSIVFEDMNQLELSQLLKDLLIFSDNLGGIPIFKLPLKQRRFLALPLLTAMTQVLGYDHHKFTTISYTTSVGNTEIKTVDDRLDTKGIEIVPEQVIVAPTTECRVDFDTVDEQTAISSSTPSILADQSLSSPIHPIGIRHQGVSAAGTLKVWAYWR